MSSLYHFEHFIFVFKMNGGNSLSQPKVEKLVGENYNDWKLCMEAYLQGQDLWDLVFGADAVIPRTLHKMLIFVENGRLNAGKLSLP